ncbi:Leucine--tRNA ligase [Bienertia sinuspersici]
MLYSNSLNLKNSQSLNLIESLLFILCKFSMNICKSSSPLLPDYALEVSHMDQGGLIAFQRIPKCSLVSFGQ